MVKNSKFTTSIGTKLALKMNAAISYKSNTNLKKGCPIVLDVAHKDTISGRTSRTRKTIGHSLVKDWNFEKDLPKLSHPDGEDLAGIIIEIKDRAKKNNFTTLTDVDEGLSYLMAHNVVSTNVFEYGKMEIERLRSVGSHSTAQVLLERLTRWEEFAPSLNFGDIDEALISRFKRERKGYLSDSTIKSYISALRKVYNIALYDSRVNLVDNGAFRNIGKGLKVKMRRARNVYLNDKNLLKLVSRNVKAGRALTSNENRALDMTLLQFYLGGANLKDVVYLKREVFYKNRVLLKRAKLGMYGEFFDVKVFKGAREIFKKHEGNDPVYLFDFCRSFKEYRSFLVVHNRSLLSAQSKLKLKISPINNRMSSNVIRHTFATRAKFLGINADIIRELMGHERNDIDTVYKDKYPEKMRDKAHKKIIKIVASS